MSNFVKIVKTSRPLMWFAHFTAFIMGGLQTSIFSFASFNFIWGILILSLPFSLFIYAINDYYDFSSDNINPRKGGIFGAKHSKFDKKSLLRWGILSFIITLIMTIFLGIYAFLTLLILSFALYCYSASIFRFKTKPILDGVFGGAFYLYFLMIFGYFAFLRYPANHLPFLSSPFIYFLILGMMFQLMGALLDIVPDRKTGLTTSAVVFGEKTVISFSLVLVFVSIYLSLESIFFKLISFTFLGICFFSYSKKFRQNDLVQKIGAAYLPLLFFLMMIIFIIIDPNLLNF